MDLLTEERAEALWQQIEQLHEPRRREAFDFVREPFPDGVAAGTSAFLSIGTQKSSTPTPSLMKAKSGSLRFSNTRGKKNSTTPWATSTKAR